MTKANINAILTEAKVTVGSNTPIVQKWFKEIQANIDEAFSYIQSANRAHPLIKKAYKKLVDQEHKDLFLVTYNAQNGPTIVFEFKTSVLLVRIEEIKREIQEGGDLPF